MESLLNDTKANTRHTSFTLSLKLCNCAPRTFGVCLGNRVWWPLIPALRTRARWISMNSGPPWSTQQTPSQPERPCLQTNKGLRLWSPTPGDGALDGADVAGRLGGQSCPVRRKLVSDVWGGAPRAALAAMVVFCLGKPHVLANSQPR